MSDVYPFMLLPAVVGWCVAERRRRVVHVTLRRSAEARRPTPLADAGVAPVAAVARSLATRPAEPQRCPWWRLGRRRSAWEVQQLVAPMELVLVEVIGLRRNRLHRPVGFTGASRFSGLRHGRQVAVELGVTHSAIVLRGERPWPAFVVVGGADGRLTASGAIPVALHAALETLAPSRHWRGLTLCADEARLTARRTAIPTASWLHDLWLAEFVADVASPADPTAAGSATRREPVASADPGPATSVKPVVAPA
ncbi:MAG: hypothetical protein QM679_05735 [Patulibacter sp.]